MNVDALSFTLLILLAEFAIGGLWVLVASDARGRQSATGLLYLAMALILSGEVLGKGLLFVTAIPS